MLRKASSSRIVVPLSRISSRWAPHHRAPYSRECGGVRAFFFLFLLFFLSSLLFFHLPMTKGQLARQRDPALHARNLDAQGWLHVSLQIKRERRRKKKRGGKATAGGQTKHAMTRALLMECCVMLRTDAREDNPTERFRGWEESRWGAAPLHPSRIRNTHSVDTKKRSATPRLGLALGPHRAHDSFILTLTAGEGSKYE